MEFVRCNLCGIDHSKIVSKETTLLKLNEPFKVVRCKNCGLTYVNPRPDIKEMVVEYQDKEYYDKYDYQENVVKVRRTSFEKAIDEINHLSQTKGNILDVGSALGDFLILASESGWEPYGVDISPYAVAYSRQRVGENISKGTLEDAKYAPNFFQAVFSSHVIEHLPDPQATLKEIFRVCQKGAVLYLQVPNELEHFFTLFYFNQQKLSLLSKIWNSFFLWLIYQTPLSEIPSPHLYFFTPKSLKRMVEKTGFKVLKIETIRENKDLESRQIGGRALKRLLYWLEEKTKRGPTIILVAIKE